MNNFDSTIIDCLNRFAKESKAFDYFIAHIVENELVKGVVVVTVLWFFWFHKSDRLNFNRGRIIIGLTAAIFAVALSRTLTLLLPFRARPFVDPNLHFVRPYYMQPEGLQKWSSFPSDNAILFFSLATCMFLISKRVGLLAYLYAFFVICFPRIYFGYHYPTDILGGALIGTAITLILSINKISNPIINRGLNFSEKYPGIFYAIFFLLSYQITNGFANSFDLIHTGLDYFRNKYQKSEMSANDMAVKICF